MSRRNIARFLDKARAWEAVGNQSTGNPQPIHNQSARKTICASPRPVFETRSALRRRSAPWRASAARRHSPYLRGDILLKATLGFATALLHLPKSLQSHMQIFSRWQVKRCTRGKKDRGDGIMVGAAKRKPGFGAGRPSEVGIADRLKWEY